MSTSIPAYEPVEVRGRQPIDVKEYSGELGPEDSVELTYYVKTNGDLEAVTRKIAEEETTGRWVGTGTPTPLFHSARAEAARIVFYDDNDGIITIRAPLSNFDLEEIGDPFYQLQMLSTGGPILEFVFYTDVAFLDFRLPSVFQAKFPGPKWGIHRSREYTELPADQPLMGTIMKPCSGLSPEEVAAKIEDASIGGCYLIKDDEKMLGPSYCALEPKVKAVAAALERALDQSGHKTIYCPQIPVRTDHLVEVAKRAVGYGATGLMFNVLMGNNLASLATIAERTDLDVPLYAHCGGLAALITGPRRIDARVICKLARLCGADYFQIGVMGQHEIHVNSLDPSLLIMMADTFREDIPTLDGKPAPIRDTVPVTAGGLSAKNLGHNLAAFKHPRWGYAFAPLAGSNILDHPESPAAGARAMWQAAEAYDRDGLTDPAALRNWAEANGRDELLALFK